MQRRPEWQTATEALLLLVVKYSGDLMLARIGIMRALNAGKPAEQPRRKATKRYRVL